jgi:hypothetical protein
VRAILYSWPAQGSAFEYEVARSTSPAFDVDCLRFTTFDTSWTDTETPVPGGAFYYLNRPYSPYPGSWGQDSEGIERTGICP